MSPQTLVAAADERKRPMARNTFRRSIGLLVAAGLMAAACGSDDTSSVSSDAPPESSGSASSEPVAGGGGKTIAVLSPDYSAQPAAKTAVDAFVAEAESRGHTATVVDTNSDNAAMNAEITTAVSQNVDAIVVAFGTPAEFGNGLSDAVAAEVPVFGLDTGGSAAGILTNVTTDAGFLGETSAQAIVDALGDEGGKVAMIVFDAFEPVRLRGVAAKELFEENGVEVIEYIQGDPADSTGFAKATVGDLLQKYPQGELDAIWAGWDATALGAFQATVEGDRTEILVTGVDGQDFAIAEVQKGTNWIATVKQDWPTIATVEMDQIEAFFAGEAPAEEVIFVDGILVTADS